MSSLAALFLFLLAAVPCRASFTSSARGTSTAQFLKLGAGARAAAMGEAFSAAADDVTALYWNPAALSRVAGQSATFMHAPYLDSSYFDYFAYGRNLGSAGTAAASLQYFSAGSFPETDQAGNELGSLSPYDLALTAGWAHKLEDAGAWGPLGGCSFGLAVKYVRSQLEDSAHTAAVDLGALSPPVAGGKLRLAFTAVNLGGRQKFESESSPLPMALRFGSAYKLTERWLAALDLVLPRDNGPVAAVGAEYRLPPSGPWSLAGRAGYVSRTAGDVGGFTGFSFGFGLGYQRLSVDYAVAPMGSLGVTQRVSLSFNM